MTASIAGTDTLISGLEGALSSLLQAALQQAGAAAASWGSHRYITPRWRDTASPARGRTTITNAAQCRFPHQLVDPLV